MPNKIYWKFAFPNIVKPVLHFKAITDGRGVEIDNAILGDLKSLSKTDFILEKDTDGEAENEQGIDREETLENPEDAAKSDPEKDENSVIRVSQETFRQMNTVAKFHFKLTRYKDLTTHLESLKIDSFFEGKENGSITTTIYSLEDDIKELMKYGVAFSAIVFRDMRKVIEENYLLLNTVPVTVESDKRFNSLIKLVDGIIGEQEDKGRGYCSIPVKEFDELAKECEYNDYEIRALREKLANGGFIQTGNGRYTVTERIKDKPVRVIRFNIAEVKKTASSEISNNEEKSGT